MNIKWIKHQQIDGRIGIIVPYNQKFNDTLKSAVPSARFREDLRTDAWFFDEEAKPDVLPILERFYVNQEWQRVEWRGLNRDHITVDGAQMLIVTRDWWKYRSDFSFKYRVIEDTLSSGGSRANPGILGDLVIEILCRPGAEFSPEPESVTAIDDPTADRPNPLAIFSEEDLAAELASRQATTAAMLKEADLLAEMRRRDIVLFDKEQIYAAMKESLEQLFPGSDGKVPEGEQDMARKLHRFVRLLRLALETKEAGA